MSTKKNEGSLASDGDDETLQVPLQLKLEVNRFFEKNDQEREKEREFSSSTSSSDDDDASGRDSKHFREAREWCEAMSLLNSVHFLVLNIHFPNE